MQNFNTNQTRQLYVAGAIDANVDSNLDIYLSKTATGELFFKYKNSDGLLTRSDLVDVKKVVSLKKTAATSLAKPLMATQIVVNTSAVTLSELVGKTLDCIITIHQYVDYDEASTRTFVASVVGDSTNTASAAAFHKALAIAIAKAIPTPDKNYPMLKVYSNGTEVTATTAAASVTGSSNGVLLVEAQQKYVRGKLSGEPITASVAFRLADGNIGDIVWGTATKMTVAAANSAHSTSISPASISGAYALADLEFFAAGEKGDMVRGFNYPNDYPFNPAIDLSKSYNVLSIEYFWSGDAENVQKSPRLIQVAAEAKDSNDVVTALYNTAYAAIYGGGSGSGSGSGSGA